MSMKSPIPFDVLLVEDTPEFATMTLSALEHFGLQASHADDGEAALKHLADNKPDLILLDLNLGGMSGWQVLEYVKQQHGEHGIPVIVLTAFSDNANRIIGKLQYVNKYLVKPFTPNELFTAISDALELDKMGV
jgi:DNA-binding response OmpR family regulator